MSVETDRELLELAAKAAGYVIDEHARNGSAWAWVYPFGAKPDGGGDYPIFKWNPLDDDGDALRLAIKLRIDIITRDSSRETWAQSPMQRTVLVPWEGNEYAATRLAIVRAAAQIGRAMP